MPIQSATAPTNSIVEAIEIKKELATQLAIATSMLKAVAIDGRAMFTAIAMNGVKNEAEAKANRKRFFLLDGANIFADHPKKNIS
ncbi:MAG: hypothetical protein QXJ19_00630 [Candidatus Bathyarchaeia archaeon]